MGRPIILSSGSRCKEHNKSEGGAKNSAHLYGLGVDISTIGWENLTILKAISLAIDLGFEGIGEGCGRLHLDCKHSHRLHWDYKVVEGKIKTVNFRFIDGGTGL